jgi:NADH dehydrogenase FAD-containing subunit
MGKHLILVGGGHAHMVTLANLHKFIEKDHHIRVIGPSPYHYYSGMGAGMLGKIYTPEDIRFATQQAVEKQGGAFVCGKAVRVNPKEKLLFLESGVHFPYDILSFNVGSYVPATLVKDDGKDIYSVKPIEKLIHARARIAEIIF